MHVAHSNIQVQYSNTTGSLSTSIYKFTLYAGKC